eukprot:4407220-Pyramimonas_sp.AAC.1
MTSCSSEYHFSKPVHRIVVRRTWSQSRMDLPSRRLRRPIWGSQLHAPQRCQAQYFVVVASLCHAP